MTTELEKLFGLKLPLVLAPLAGGGSTPELVAAVCNAGGLGSLGAAYLKPANILAEIEQTKRLTSKPFVVNLFVPYKDPAFSEEQISRAFKATAPYREELKLPTPQLKPPFSENFDEQFEAVLKSKPAAFSFTFGTLDSYYLEACRNADIFLIGTATSLEEAEALADSGVDAITLQGLEAGGHRGIFDVKQDDPMIPALELTRLCAKRIHLPLITAGGLMNGTDIAAALQAGAQAAQLGTAFLTCPESGASKPYKKILSSLEKKETKLTRVFSGRIARGIENRFMKEMEAQPDAILPFPAQNVFTRDLRKASAEQGSPDFLSLWAGTAVNKTRTLSARDLVQALHEEYQKSK